MSEENVELVRQLQPGPEVDLVALFRDEALASAAREAVAPFFDPSFEAIAHGVQPKRGRGIDGLREVWLDWLAPYESYRVEIDEIIDAGERVVILLRDFGRPVGSEREVRVDGTAIWTIRDGKVVRAEFFADRAEALRAAGLSA